MNKYADIHELINFAKNKQFDKMIIFLKTNMYCRYTIYANRHILLDTPNEIKSIIIDYIDSVVETI